MRAQPNRRVFVDETAVTTKMVRLRLQPARAAIVRRSTVWLRISQTFIDGSHPDSVLRSRTNTRFSQRAKVRACPFGSRA